MATPPEGAAGDLLAIFHHWELADLRCDRVAHHLYFFVVSYNMLSTHALLWRYWKGLPLYSIWILFSMLVSNFAAAVLYVHVKLWCPPLWCPERQNRNVQWSTRGTVSATPDGHVDTLHANELKRQKQMAFTPRPMGTGGTRARTPTKSTHKRRHRIGGGWQSCVMKGLQTQRFVYSHEVDFFSLISSYLLMQGMSVCVSLCI